MCVAQCERVDVCIVEGVQPEVASHCFFYCATTAVMLDGIFGGGTTPEKPSICCVVSALPPSVSVPSVPDGAEDSSPDAGCCCVPQGF